MQIRCQNCQALFTLQDGVAAAGVAFQAQCGRCHAVFPAPVVRRKLDDAQATRGAARPAIPAPAPRERSGPQAAPRPDADRPSTDEFEAELVAAAQSRRRLLVAGAAGAVVLLAAIGFLLLRPRLFGLPAEAKARLAQAREKLLLDDAASLDQAASLLTEAARLAPGEAAPEAERGFALLLGAASHKDVADRLEQAARELRDQAARLELEKPEGFAAQVAALSDRVKGIATEREPHVRDSNRLLQQGVAAAKAALDEDGQDVAALRAMALYCALSDAPERGARYLEAAQKRAPADALVAYTRAALALAGAPSREKQDKALGALAVARQQEPRLLRAEYDAAAISFDRHEPGPARAALTRLVGENPAHERAQRLLALLPAP